MKYPFCGYTATQVTDTRMSEEGDIVCCRRRCGSYDRRFTAYERIELFLLVIIRKDGSRVDYDRNKVKDSVCLVLRKCPVSAEAIDEAIICIEGKLLSHGEKEIGSDRMGELVTRELKRLDRVGYIRFTSVYRSFEDLVELWDVLGEVAAASVRK